MLQCIVRSDFGGCLISVVPVPGVELLLGPAPLSPFKFFIIFFLIYIIGSHNLDFIWASAVPTSVLGNTIMSSCEGAVLHLPVLP